MHMHACHRRIEYPEARRYSPHDKLASVFSTISRMTIRTRPTCERLVRVYGFKAVRFNQGEGATGTSDSNLKNDLADAT